MQVRTKLTLILSSIFSFSFAVFSLYKGIILYLINKQISDTFVGGNTSDISIVLWFVIAGIFILLTLMFLFFLKIKDLKSIRIILLGILVFWLLTSVFLIFTPILNSMFSLLSLTLCFISFWEGKNLKKEIINSFKSKKLSSEEIHLLQLLAKTKK